MGLFSGGKTCPICGGSTPKLFPTKVEGLPLCKDCAAKISMDYSILNKLTINGLWDHMDYRTANKEAYDNFKNTESYAIGGDNLCMDLEKSLFYLASGKPENPPLFKFSEIVSYSLVENGKTIAQGNRTSCSLGDSSIYVFRIPPRKYKEVIVNNSSSSAPAPAPVPPAPAPAPKGNMLMQGANNAASRPVQAGGPRPGAGHTSPAAMNGSRGAVQPGNYYNPQPETRMEEERPDRPIDSLKLNLVLDNPYWKDKHADFSIPYLGEYNDFPNWINEYKILVSAAMDVCAALSRVMGVKSDAEKASEVKEKADAIAAIHNAEAAAKDAEAAAKEAKAADLNAAVEMIKKWKELLDMGAITQEEFDKKKAEILG